jgi:predicted MFS family arabinose efflux permease
MSWEILKKVIKDTSTGIDGKTFCASRVWGHIGGFSYLGFSAYNVYTTHDFNYIAFATGFAAIVGSVAGAIWAKKDTEPSGGA